MSFAETAVLGAIAGFTIYIGLPLGRMERVDDRTRVGLAMLSVGILAFIFMDVTTHGQEIVSDALSSFKDHHDSFGHVLGLFALLAVGFTVGVAEREQVGAQRELGGHRASLGTPGPWPAHSRSKRTRTAAPCAGRSSASASAVTCAATSRRAASS